MSEQEEGPRTVAFCHVQGRFGGVLFSLLLTRISKSLIINGFLFVARNKKFNLKIYEAKGAGETAR